MNDPVVKLEHVWKIFGERSDEAMNAVLNEGLTKPEVLERFKCVVGVQDASFEVARGEFSASWVCPVRASQRLCVT